MTDEANQETSKTEKQLLMDRCRMMGISFSNNASVESLRSKIEAKLSGEQQSPDSENDEDGEDCETDTDGDGIPDNVDPQVDADSDGHDDRTGQFVDGNQEAAKTKPEVEAPVPHALATTTESGNITPPAPKAKRPMTKAERDNELRAQLKREKMALVRVRITNLNPSKKDLPGEIFTVANKYLGTVRKYVPYGEVTDNGYHIPVCIFEQLEDRKFQNIRTVKDRRTGVNRVETSWAKEFAIEVLPQLTQEELDRLANAQAAAGSIDR